MEGSLQILHPSWCYRRVLQLCLYVLITTSDLAISAPNNTIMLTVGVAWTCLTAIVGIVAVSAHPLA